MARYETPPRRQPPPALPQPDSGDAEASLSSPLLAAGRGILYALLTLLLIPLQLLANALRLPLRRSLPQAYHRLVCWIMGINIAREGEISRARPTLFVANHTSYLDIEIIGAVAQGSFVAMDEIRGWPGFGVLARLQRSIFIDCEARSLSEQTREIRARLDAGENIFLFPEGGSHTGLHLLPFRSSLFAVAQRPAGQPPLVVQPVTVVYEQLDGQPLGRHWRWLYAWNGKPSILRHMFQAAGLGRLTVRVIFHEPGSIQDFANNRKALCAHCFDAIQGSMSQVLAGTDSHAALASPQVLQSSPE